MTDRLEPMTPAGCDLRDFPHTPLFRSRLFGSSFHARANDSELRAGVTLWLKSWDQVPAGSLPDDDIELCRLAELARDVKAWKKHKAGALRGWVVCTDGRMYHPVVAEGVNNAIEKKATQRLKTAKARIAALEKRLKEAKTDGDKAHITEEIRKIQQTLSQTIGKSVTDLVTGSKEREGEGEAKGEGNSYSDPNGSGGEPPSDREVVFANGVPLLTAAGVLEKNARSMLAMLSKKHGETAVVQAIAATARDHAGEPVAWLQTILNSGPTAKGKPNAQEALEASNRAVAAQFLAERAHAPQ